MAHFITIAGPQSSGKTTTMEYLKVRHPDWQFIDEVNPRTFLKSDTVGLVNTDADLERQMSDKDIEIINNIDKSKNVFFECGISHYAYILYFLSKNEAEQYFQKYLKAHAGLSSIIVFIDTIPEVSWERRKEIYINRIKKNKITDEKEIKATLNKQRNLLFKLYPYWLDTYKKIPFPKIIIENSNKSKEEFLKEIERTIESLLSR